MSEEAEIDFGDLAKQIAESDDEEFISDVYAEIKKLYKQSGEKKRVLGGGPPAKKRSRKRRKKRTKKKR